MRDPLSPSGRLAVEGAREAWIRRLVDTSRRNNLLYFRDLRVGTLNLANAREGAVEELLMGARVPLASLVPDDPKAPARLREIARKALSNLEERGLETLYLAYGMATWPVGDGGRPPEAAAVLVPLVVEGKASPMLVRSGPPRPNLALLHALAAMGFEPEMDEESEDAVAMVGRLQAGVSLDGFAVGPRAVVGNFSFQKLAMVRDLEDLDALAAHDLVAALAGDPEARREVASRRVALDPRLLDSIRPEEEFMPLDADSSQQAVVHAVARGSDGVIQGPPGCGKSQTIANLVATLVAQGRKVLFVAEKRAALEAVHKRLEARGLGGLALDLHGATISQRAVVARIGEALASIREAAAPDDEALNARFVERRDRMLAHDARMHAPRAPSGMSVYQLQAALIGSPARSKTRWRGADLARLTPDVAVRAQDLLEEAMGHRDLFLGKGPWAGANLPDGHAAQDALDAARELAAELPPLRRSLAEVAGSMGVPAPTTFVAMEGFVSLFRDTEPYAAKYNLRILPESVALWEAMRPGTRDGLAGLWARWFGRGYKAARSRLRALTHDGNGDPKDLPSLAALSQRWVALGVIGPTAALPKVASAAWERVESRWTILRTALPNAEGDDMEAYVGMILADEASARAVPRVRAIEAELEALGVGRIVEELRSVIVDFGLPIAESRDPQSEIDDSPWPALFRDAWLRSCYDDARAEDPGLAGFSGLTHEAFAEEFRALDRRRVEGAAARVRRAHAEAAVAAMNAHPEQTDRVRAEAQKRSRLKPLRRLLAEAPDVLPAVLPCWMASPLNVSGLLPAQALFDVVVFDEASQVLPEDAVGAILRGRRLVVAGDRHQLPPTVFFADGADDEDDASEVAGFQSLLDQVGSFLEPWPLLWHYRSHDERLIAFSNRFVYGDRLVTFPGVGTSPCVESVVVPPSLEASPSVPTPSLAVPSEESNAAEVAKVVELVLAHATQTPDVSLGVIAMGLKHAQRIEDALDHALDDHPELEPFFDPRRPERFFVKNLERVQGDERDAILISIGYGKDAAGRLPYRFGPLLQEGGERRLNVAVTRARRHMTVVSSFSHLDMDPARSKARGVVLLREFLQFAASGGAGLEGTKAAVEALDPFEADVLQALAARGIPLTPRYGTSGQRLDFAVPEEGFALESDGPTYHALATARDRDRLRPQQLTALGWRFYRLWSTDWTNHRQREIDAAVSAWEGLSLPSGRWRVESVSPSAAPPAHRPAPPTVESLDDIEDVPLDRLDALVRWVMEGGVKTDDEIVDETSERLGFARAGAKIDRTVRASITRIRESL